jgi:uncharacterized circularly permuted ATP-grasp superfamily protein/uncharacterized alpha-E superfamily protein
VHIGSLHAADFTQGVTQSLFDSDPEQDTARIAASLAAPARPGHRDELRAHDGALRPEWREFFGHLGPGGYGDLARRRATIERQVREDGITYNVYSEDGLSERPWSLDLLPFLINSEDWTRLEAGIAQRARLMSAIMRDVYGPQRLLAENLLPPALVLGHPGYLRPLVGHRPAGDTFLHILAFDVARAEDGQWWVVGNRTQAPSGLGYALQNRLIVSRLFPESFRRMKVQRLAASYRCLLDTLQRCSPCGVGESARLVLLTPGPYNETYFEHAYLARYLGIPLVEGSDLTVRDDRTYLKALHGLLPVHGILRRLDDNYCDPLELLQDSTIGVPGLLQSIRAGRVLVANALGSGFLESPAINGFLPAIARRELGEDLQLPSLASWWCGERAAFRQVAQDLSDKVLKATFPATAQRPAFEPMIGASLDREQMREAHERIEADPDAHTVQAYLPLPQAPTWHDGSLVPRAAMVRVFAISDGGGGWHVMPGGLTRIAQREQRVVSMQRGGASQDTWVQTAGPVDTFSMLPRPLGAAELAARRRIVSSRAAENLFWMGRYTERTDHTVRLARSALTLLGDDTRAPSPVLGGLATLCQQQGLVPHGVPSPALSAAVFERTLIAGLADAKDRASVSFTLQALVRAATHIRDRLSADHWRLIAATLQRFRSDCAAAVEDQVFSPDEAVAALGHLAIQLSAVTGAQLDHMTRDDGWRLLTIGRWLERLGSLSLALQVLFSSGAASRDDGFDLVLQLFDSTITYRALYQRRLEAAPLIELLVLEQANPRSLRGVARRLGEQIERLGAPEARDLLAHLPTQQEWPNLEALCRYGGLGPDAPLLQFCDRLVDGTRELSNAIGAHYFSHASAEFRTVHA